jgi:hypothetical protein
VPKVQAASGFAQARQVHQGLDERRCGGVSVKHPQHFRLAHHLFAEHEGQGDTGRGPMQHLGRQQAPGGAGIEQQVIGRLPRDGIDQFRKDPFRTLQACGQSGEQPAFARPRPCVEDRGIRPEFRTGTFDLLPEGLGGPDHHALAATGQFLQNRRGRVNVPFGGHQDSGTVSHRIVTESRSS